MIRLRMKNYNTILIEQLQKYKLYHQTKLISMSNLLVKKYYLLIKDKYYNKLNLLILLWKKLLKKKKKIEDQGEKQIKAIQNQGQVKKN